MGVVGASLPSSLHSHSLTHPVCSSSPLQYGVRALYGGSVITLDASCVVQVVDALYDAPVLTALTSPSHAPTLLTLAPPSRSLCVCVCSVTIWDLSVKTMVARWLGCEGGETSQLFNSEGVSVTYSFPSI